jgi:hypothetical protein
MRIDWFELIVTIVTIFLVVTGLLFGGPGPDDGVYLFPAF